MKVAITGAGGVVGSAVLRHLVAGGASVRAVVRSDGAAELVRGLGASPVRADVLDAPSLVPAFRGVEVVYHVAGLNRMCARHPDELMRVNVDGSRNALRAARAAGAGRFVYTSSAVTVGEAAGTVGSELSAHRGHYLSHYERSKHVAERVVLAEASGLEVVVVNPSSVQGPGRAGGTGRLILDLINGRLPVLVDTRLSVVDIDDCARGHLLAAASGRPGERYLLNSFTLRVGEAVELVESVIGRSLPVRYVPGWVAATGGALVEAVFRAAGRTPPICREMVRTLRHGHAYDGSRATRELGLEYTSAEETLTRLVRWAERSGLVATAG